MNVKVQQEVNEVTKGIVIYAVIASLILSILTKETIQSILGVVFGSIIAILNFRLLALTMEKAVDLPPGKAQAYTASRYLVRLCIVAVVVFVSVNNPHINVIGTILGLISTQIVIFVKKLLISKFSRKGV